MAEGIPVMCSVGSYYSKLLPKLNCDLFDSLDYHYID